MKKFIFMALAIGAFTFTSCSDDDDGGGGASCEELISNYQDALEAYAEDSSEENCLEAQAASEALENSDCEGMWQSFPCE